MQVNNDSTRPSYNISGMFHDVVCFEHLGQSTIIYAHLNEAISPESMKWITHLKPN